MGAQASRTRGGQYSKRRNQASSLRTCFSGFVPVSRHVYGVSEATTYSRMHPLGTWIWMNTFMTEQVEFVATVHYSRIFHVSSAALWALRVFRYAARAELLIKAGSFEPGLANPTTEDSTHSYSPHPHRPSPTRSPFLSLPPLHSLPIILPKLPYALSLSPSPSSSSVLLLSPSSQRSSNKHGNLVISTLFLSLSSRFLNRWKHRAHAGADCGGERSM